MKHCPTWSINLRQTSFGQVQLEFEIFKTNVADTWQLFLNVWSFCMVILLLQVWFRVFFS